MKKTFTLLIGLLAAVFNVLAQDTITGVVSRVDAPYFEQNVCDTRFAIVSEDDTYFVMVDNYWPNPYLEDLVIHYDTIAIGNEISVVGEVLEMEDGNGETFGVIDILQLIDANNSYFYSCIYWMGDFHPIAFHGPDVSYAFAIPFEEGPLCFVVIDGLLQTDYAWTINGEVLNPSSRYLFVGSYEMWTDYYGDSFMVFNLKLAIPNDIATSNIEGALTLNNGLNMDVPCLSVYDGTNYYYLTIKGALQYSFINPDLYEESTAVTVGGVEAIRYDMFGRAFNSFEIVELQLYEAKTLFGVLQDAPMPAVGLTLPGMILAFFSGDYFYYLDNSIIIDNGGYESIVVDSDTISYGSEIAANFTSRMRIDDYFELYYHILISEAVITNGIEKAPVAGFSTYLNLSDGTVCIVSENTMKNVVVYDSMGRVLINRFVQSKNENLNIGDSKGVIIISVAFNDGYKTTKKMILR